MVLSEIAAPKGELTIVAELGLKPNNERQARPDGPSLLLELAHLTENDGISRRKGINALARRHGLTPNEVYAAIETAKKLAE